MSRLVLQLGNRHISICKAPQKAYLDAQFQTDFPQMSGDFHVLYAVLWKLGSPIFIRDMSIKYRFD